MAASNNDNVQVSETVKFNVSMKRSLFEKIDSFADDMGLNRSAFIALCCSQYMNSQDTLNSMDQLTKLVKDIGSKGSMSSEDEKQLDAFTSMFQSLIEN